MEFTEKINIPVSETVFRTLQRDAEMFEIFKKNRIDTNRNKFLTMLIKGFYKPYKNEQESKFNIIFKELLLQSEFDDPLLLEYFVSIADNNMKLHQAIKALMENAKFNGRIYRNHKELASSISQLVKEKKELAYSVKVKLDETPETNSGIKEKRTSIAYKPVESIKEEFDEIEEDVHNISFAKYIGKMLTCYSQKNPSERERYIFSKNYIDLLNFCSNRNSTIVIRLSQTNEKHELIPYKVSYGKEELFNYLLGIEYKTKAVCTFRLCRIESIRKGEDLPSLIDEKVIKGFNRLDKMIISGPQFPIFSDDRCIVSLTDQGEKLYRQIYIGRPPLTEKMDIDGRHIYYFDCSDRQVFQYFRRFGVNATVLGPQKLRHDTASFHHKAAELYADDSVLQEDYEKYLLLHASGKGEER